MLRIILGLIPGSLYAIVMGPTTLAASVAALNVENFSLPAFLIGSLVLAGLEFLRKYLPDTAEKRQSRSAARRAPRVLTG